MPRRTARESPEDATAVNSRRMIVALIAALLISGACTLLLGRGIGTKPAPAAPTVKYVVAAQPIAAGEVVKTAFLKTVSWPASRPLHGAFHKIAGVTGRPALYPIAAGQPLVEADLAPPGEGLGLAAHIPDGMRAVALRTDDVVAVGGFIYPGSHVDVLVTYRVTSNSQPVTAVVLQNVTVLATGQKTEPDPKGKPTSVSIVTLLLTPAQAERAVLASTQGAIHFVLRNGVDQKHILEAPVDLAQLAGNSRPDARRARRSRPHRSPGKIRPAPYTVETILGNHTEKTSF